MRHGPQRWPRLVPASGRGWCAGCARRPSPRSSVHWFNGCARLMSLGIPEHFADMDAAFNYSDVAFIEFARVLAGAAGGHDRSAHGTVDGCLLWPDPALRGAWKLLPPGGL